MLASLAAAIASFGVLACMFVPLERFLPARKQRVFRKAWAVDASFFLGQYLVWNGVAFALLSWLHPFLHIAPLIHQPAWLQAVLAVALGDASVYWFHRACHKYEFLWRFHAVHHTTEHLDWLAAHREHPIDGIGTQLAQNLPAMMLGLDLRLLAGLVVFRACWAIFVHSNVKLPLGPLRWVLGSPELHHWHHARREHTEHNFANLAPWLDWLFGTHHLPSGHETYPLGVTEQHPVGYFGQLVWPFRPRGAGVGVGVGAGVGVRVGALDRATG